MPYLRVLAAFHMLQAQHWSHMNLYQPVPSPVFTAHIKEQWSSLKGCGIARAA